MYGAIVFDCLSARLQTRRRPQTARTSLGQQCRPQARRNTTTSPRLITCSGRPGEAGSLGDSGEEGLAGEESVEGELAGEEFGEEGLAGDGQERKDWLGVD